MSRIVVVSLMIAASLAPARARAGKTARPAASPHAVTVTIKGPVALVDVVRELPQAHGEALLDVALPARAALIDVEVGTRGHWTRARTADATKAKDAYLASVQSRGLTAIAEPFDDATSYRFRVLSPPDGVRGEGGGALLVHYVYSTLVEPAGARWRVRFPPAAEATPVGADVQATVLAPPGQTLADLEIAGVRTPAPRGGKRITANGQSSERTGWEISFGFHPSAAGAPGGRSTPAAFAEVLAASSAITGRESALALGARVSTPPLTTLPERVLLVIDRSRSVGPAGLALERDVARQLLEGLPPSTQFDALFFDRATKRLFPAARAATLEALATLDDEMVPARLVNGSDVEGAMRAAGDLLRMDAAAFGPRALLVLVTDGAFPEDQTGAALSAALGRTPGVAVQLAMLTIRPAEDESTPLRGRKALRGLAGEKGGVESEIAASLISDGVRAALDSLRRGGDLFAVRLGAGDDSYPLAAALPPGAGATGVVRLKGKPGAAELRATLAGRALRTPVRPMPIEAAWLGPHVAGSGKPGRADTRLAVTPAVVMLVEPVVHAEPDLSGAGKPAGELDRTVVRNTLSLAYMPRARACYQNRPMGTPKARELSGRVRISIDMVRGEVSNADIELSTLKEPSIEKCLRDAAYDIDVPRAWRKDAPASAVLNLVFAPRSAEAQRKMDEDSPVGPEIDLILEQLPPENDLGDLLLTAPPPAMPPVEAPPPAPTAPSRPTAPPVQQKFE